MAKSFKKFRDDYDDEWDMTDDDVSFKEQRMQARRDRKKTKVQEKYSVFEEGDD